MDSASKEYAVKMTNSTACKARVTEHWHISTLQSVTFLSRRARKRRGVRATVGWIRANASILGGFKKHLKTFWLSHRSARSDTPAPRQSTARDIRVGSTAIYEASCPGAHDSANWAQGLAPGV